MILDLDVFGLCAQSRVSPCCCGSKTWTSHQKLPEQDPFDLCANNTWTARSTHVHGVFLHNTNLCTTAKYLVTRTILGINAIPM